MEGCRKTEGKDTTKRYETGTKTRKEALRRAMIEEEVPNDSEMQHKENPTMMFMYIDGWERQRKVEKITKQCDMKEYRKQ